MSFDRIPRIRSIEFIVGFPEPVVPDVQLTRSRDGSTGVATFTFDNPSFLAANTQDLGETTGMYLKDSEGTLKTSEVTATFTNGRPRFVKGIVVLKGTDEWDRYGSCESDPRRPCRLAGARVSLAPCAHPTLLSRLECVVLQLHALHGEVRRGERPWLLEGVSAHARGARWVDPPPRTSLPTIDILHHSETRRAIHSFSLEGFRGRDHCPSRRGNAP